MLRARSSSSRQKSRNASLTGATPVTARTLCSPAPAAPSCSRALRVKAPTMGRCAGPSTRRGQSLGRNLHSNRNVMSSKPIDQSYVLRVVSSIRVVVDGCLHGSSHSGSSTVARCCVAEASPRRQSVCCSIGNCSRSSSARANRRGQPRLSPKPSIDRTNAGISGSDGGANSLPQPDPGTK
jgi:hypothetical protein